MRRATRSQSGRVKRTGLGVWEMRGVSRMTAATLVLAAAGIAAALALGGAAPGASVDAAQPTFQRIVIDQGALAQVTHANGIGDLNGDGLVDVVAAGDSRLAWFRNPDWRGQEIASGAWGTGSNIAVRDLDGDGRNDVVVRNPRDLSMCWFRNTGTGWQQYLMSDQVLCHNMDFGDINGDGRADIACADASGR